MDHRSYLRHFHFVLASLSPFVYEISNENNHTLNSNCIQRSRKIICGSYIQLFKVMVDVLNFTIEWVNVEDNKYGSFDKAKNKWNGVIGALAENRADFSLLHFSVTIARNKVIQYTAPITETEARMYMKKPSYSGSWETFVDVFDGDYWFALIGLSVLTSCICCFHFLVGERDSGVSKCISNFGSGVSFVCLAFSSQDTYIVEKISNPSAKSAKILFFTVCLFGMMNHTMYCGKLISFLLVKDTPLPINSLEDILRHPEYQLMVQAGSAEEDYFKLSTDWPQNEIWNKTMNGRKEAFVSSVSMDSTLMKDGKRILFCTSYYSEMYMPNYPCNIKKLNGAYLQGSSNALAFPLESPYHKLFSHILTRIQSFGTWDLISTRMDENRFTVPCSIQKDENMAFGYENIFSVFVMLGIGLGTAVGYSCLEIIYYEFVGQSKQTFDQYRPRKKHRKIKTTRRQRADNQILLKSTIRRRCSYTCKKV